jgi:hypothetical protein
MTMSTATTDQNQRVQTEILSKSFVEKETANRFARPISILYLAVTEAIPSTLAKQTVISLSQGRVTPPEQEDNISTLSQIKEDILEWWVGNIESVGTQEFTATLEDLSGQQSIVEFSKSEVPPEDLGSVIEGAKIIFYITREDSPRGRRVISQLQFLPMKALQTSDIENIKALAEKSFPEESSF